MDEIECVKPTLENCKRCNHPTCLIMQICKAQKYVQSDSNSLLVCPACGGRAIYCDDGPSNQRVDCCGEGKTESDGCGLTVWGMRSRAQARAVWNAIPRAN